MFNNEIIMTVDNTEIQTTNNETNTFNVPKGFINTIGIADDASKKKVLNALNDSISLNEFMDTELHIVDCITIPGVRKGRNGMPDTECVNVHLIDENGVSYFSQSDGVARAVRAFAGLWPFFGHSTEKGYIALKCIAKELPNGNTIKSLVLVD